ncbi:MAG: LysM peptidoglycan-binding domain-containing protein, partial [Acidobacteriota bacterium]|nr:LysM peptidoglycan-binding domain-containing protein [Acidobacteriota bacterium]
ATRAAARHLHDLYNHFGDWYLAIAAYNCGPGNVEKAVERTGYADFWELRNRRALPAETTSYVPIILAMTIMTKNAAEYGLDNIVPEPPIEYDTIDVSAPTNLALIGDLTETPVSQLAQLNPALLRNIAPEGYSVRVPKGTGQALTAAIEAVPANRRASWRMHRVESGETLAAIARRFNSAAGSIAAANGLVADEPIEGDRLVIPASFQDDEGAPPVRSRSRNTSRNASRPSAIKSHAKITRSSTKSGGHRVHAGGHAGSAWKRAALPKSSGTLASVNSGRNSLDR